MAAYKDRTKRDVNYQGNGCSASVDIKSMQTDEERMR